MKDVLIIVDGVKTIVVEGVTKEMASKIRVKLLHDNESNFDMEGLPRTDYRTRNSMKELFPQTLLVRDGDNVTEITIMAADIQTAVTAFKLLDDK